MKSPLLVRRYALGFVGAIGDEAEFRAASRELDRFIETVESRKELKRLLVSPFLSQRKKLEVLDDVARLLGTGDKTARLLRLLVEHKRFEIVRDVAQALPEAWDEKQGVLAFEVTSAVPLSPEQQERLRSGLESSERKPVRLTFRVDPSVLGGVSLKRGQVIRDATLEANLDRLREIIHQG
jgi:F-type H+-transporting ATPase subunit delta